MGRRRFSTVALLAMATLLAACGKNKDEGIWGGIDTIATADEGGPLAVAATKDGDAFALWQGFSYSQTPEGDGIHTDVASQSLSLAKQRSNNTWSDASTLGTGTAEVFQRLTFEDDIEVSREQTGTRILMEPRLVADLGTDSDGQIRRRAVALWLEKTTNGEILLQSSQFDGSSWSTATSLNDSLGGNALAPQLAIHWSMNQNDSVAVAVWQQWEADTQTYAIYSASLNLGGNWSAVERISPAGVNAKAPRIAMANRDDESVTNAPGAGLALAAWLQQNTTAGAANDQSQYNVYARRRLTSGWSGEPVQLVSDGLGEASNIDLTLNGSGNGWITWQQRNSPGASSYVHVSAYSSLTDTWTAPESMIQQDDPTTTEQEHLRNGLTPRIAMNDDHEAVVVWRHQYSAAPLADPWNSSRRVELWSNYYDGSTWVGMEALIGDSRFRINDIRLALSHEGFVAVWEQQQDSTLGPGATIHASIGKAGEWSAASLLSRRGVKNKLSDLYRDSQGNLSAAWVEGLEDGSVQLRQVHLR